MVADDADLGFRHHSPPGLPAPQRTTCARTGQPGRRGGNVRSAAWRTRSSTGTAPPPASSPGGTRAIRTRSSSARSCSSRPRSTASSLATSAGFAGGRPLPPSRRRARATSSSSGRASATTGGRCSLHRAAQHVAEQGWPDDLTWLPGVGEYTAAALENFAFGRDVLPRDVNVARVERRTRSRVYRPGRAGVDGPGRDDLSRTRPALRPLPARGGLSVARHAGRAAASAVAVRGLVPTAPRGARSGLSPRRSAAKRSSTRTQSARWRATGSWSSRTAASRCLPRTSQRPSAYPGRASG